MHTRKVFKTLKDNIKTHSEREREREGGGRERKTMGKGV